MSDAGMKSPVEPLPRDGAESKAMLSVVPTAGAQLSAARIQLGLSLQQVADQLKLSQRQVAALENNQFDDLPKMVIVRGFVRSYAKLLKLDAGPIINCLPSDNASSGLEADLRPTLATPFMESRTPFLGRQDSNNRKYLIGAIVLAVCAVIFVGVQKLEQNESFKGFISALAYKKNSEAAPGKSAENSEVAPVKLADDKSTPVTPTAAASVDEMKVEALAPPASLPKLNQEPQAASNIATTVPAPNVAPLVDAEPATIMANNQLKLKFKQDSWIQIKHENGSIVTSHLAKAGTEEVFDMKDALQLRIGNAAGVEAWLRGAALEIVPGQGSNVANLNVK